MTQYQSPINALFAQLPQLAMQMYQGSREDKYRAEIADREDRYRNKTASREDKYRDKEMQFQKNNAAFSQGIQNRNADIAEDNAEQARLSAIAQRNLYAEQLLVAKQTREANDPNTVMFRNENPDSPLGAVLTAEQQAADENNNGEVTQGEWKNYSALQEYLIAQTNNATAQTKNKIAISQLNELNLGADDRKTIRTQEITAGKTKEELSKIQLNEVKREVSRSSMYDRISSEIDHIPGTGYELQTKLFEDPTEEFLLKHGVSIGVGAGCFGPVGLPIAAAAFLGAKALQTERVNPQTINKILSHKQRTIAGWAQDMRIKPEEMGLFRAEANKYFDWKLGMTLRERATGYTKHQRGLLGKYLEGTAYDYNKIGTSYPGGYGTNLGQMPPRSGQ